MAQALAVAESQGEAGLFDGYGGLGIIYDSRGEGCVGGYGGEEVTRYKYLKRAEWLELIEEAKVDTIIRVVKKIIQNECIVCGEAIKFRQRIKINLCFNCRKPIWDRIISESIEKHELNPKNSKQPL